jgi:hypothetical protein
MKARLAAQAKSVVQHSTLVAGLIRLYPSRWRAEYGAELAGVLLQRPLGAGAVLNVVCNAVWQQLRMQEPWLIVGAPLLVWVFVLWIALLSAPGYAAHIGGEPAWVGLVLFFSTGCWTVLRRGHGGGRAALKLCMIVALPFFGAGLLVLMHAMRVVTEPAGGVGFRLGTSAGQGRGDLFTIFVAGPVMQIPCAGLIGWLGGLAGRVFRRARQLAV